ncbi:MAG: hypothetical protein ACLGI6_11060 [Gammaproteobacteria bacterium]
MSRWRTETQRIAIGAAHVQHGQAQLAARAGDWPAVGAELARLLPAASRIDAVVADVWVRYFLLQRPDGVETVRDARLLLQARFESLYGASAADWVLQADWQSEGPMLACALPRALAQALAPFRLARLQPLALHTWNRVAPKLGPSGAWCAQADGQLNLMSWQDGTLRVVRQQRGTDADALLALELARLDLPLPTARYWTGAQAPAGWEAL